MESTTFQDVTRFENNCAPSLFKPNGIDLKAKSAAGLFSFFPRPVTNNTPTDTINALEAYDLITSNRYAINTRLLRSLTDPVKARQFKARNFDYCCFSGVFSKRSIQGLISHSGFLTLDFDHLDDAGTFKKLLIENDSFETVMAFISPSGHGVKWIVKIDLNQYSHATWFYCIAEYIKYRYKIEADKSGKDVSRCCFLPYDPEAYINLKFKH